MKARRFQKEEGLRFSILKKDRCLQAERCPLHANLHRCEE